MSEEGDDTRAWRRRSTGSVVGLFGISGVGKTWLAARIVEAMPEVMHLQASALLRHAHGVDGEALRTAARDDLHSNQSVLASAVAAARLGREGRPVLIDAHSVIDNDAELVEVPFEAIAPVGIAHYLFLAADPKVIALRRSWSDRSRPERAATVLATHQRRALAVCRAYASRTGRPFTLLDSPDPQRAAQVALEVFRGLDPPLDRSAV